MRRGLWVVLVGAGCAAGAPVGLHASEPQGRLVAERAPIELAPAPSVVIPGPDGPDRLRGLIYRIDGEAHVARLHPDESLDHAKAAARMANDLGARTRAVPMLRPGAARLQASAEALSHAAQRREPADVRAAAIAVEREGRAFDDLIPAPPPAR